MRERDQLRLGKAQRGAGVFDMGLRRFEVVEGVGEGGRHGNDVALDREATEAATVGEADGVAGFRVHQLIEV